MIRFAKLELPSSRVIKEELGTYSSLWVPHFNTNHYMGEWTVLALRSPGGKQSPIPESLSGTSYEDTEALQHFSSVSELLSSLQCPIMSVRFLNLKAGAEIKSHRDRELAFEMGEARLHFPIVTNPEVEFYVEEDRIIMEEGECWYINANLTHRVANKGKTDRIHLVIDCKVNDWLEKIFRKGTKTIRKKDKENEQKKLIISELRMQNTAASISLADQLENDLSHE